MIFTVNSCKKLDIQKEQKPEISSSESFFSKTSALAPSVERIYSVLQFQDSKNPFVEEFVKKQGVPLWNYAIIQERESSYGNITSQSINSNSSNQQTKDTIVKIPLQLIGYKTVHGYLLCKISNNKIQLLVKDGRSYKDYGYMQNNNSSTSAEALSAELMSINNKIFGINYFEITDSKLFGNNQSKKYASFKNDSVISNKVSPNSVLCPGGRTSITITTTTTNCPYSGRCLGPNGSCDNCVVCQTTSTERLDICSQDGPGGSTSGTGSLVWTLDATVSGVIPTGIPTPGWIPTPTDPCESSTSGSTTITVCGLGWEPATINLERPRPRSKAQYILPHQNRLPQDSTTDTQVANMCVLKTLEHISTFLGKQILVADMLPWAATNLYPGKSFLEAIQEVTSNGILSTDIPKIINNFFDSSNTKTLDTAEKVRQSILDGYPMFTYIIIYDPITGLPISGHAVMITGFNADFNATFEYFDPQLGRYINTSINNFQQPILQIKQVK